MKVIVEVYTGNVRLGVCVHFRIACFNQVKSGYTGTVEVFAGSFRRVCASVFPYYSFPPVAS